MNRRDAVLIRPRSGTTCRRWTAAAKPARITFLGCERPVFGGLSSGTLINYRTSKGTVRQS